MANLIWDKKGAAVDTRIQRFLAGDDVVLDRALFAFDLRASMAHVRGLARIGVLAAGEAELLLEELEGLSRAWEDGRFVLDERFEDGHSAIEAHLIERLGDAGRKVHTGRSRNDQVQVALRLFLKDALTRLEALCLDSAQAFLTRARAGEGTPMPGYTHLQRAMPSSVGLWMAAFTEALVDDAELARSTRDWLDASPLGTAAGYGINLPLDREGVAKELGFARVLISPMYAQNSRGKMELQALVALAQALGDVRRFAWDLSLFTTAEFGFVRLPNEHTTGSSIMPNKRNPDLVELLRASPAVVWGAISEIQSVLSLPSGYQRDLQATKGPLLRAFASGIEALGLVTDVVSKMTFDEERMRVAVSPDMFATDRAVELTAHGVPFRTAYRMVADEPSALDARKPEDSLRARVSLGGTAALGLDVLEARLVAAKERLAAPSEPPVRDTTP
jgi:argininosuccinate lyase